MLILKQLESLHADVKLMAKQQYFFKRKEEKFVSQKYNPLGITLPYILNNCQLIKHYILF